jgi:hypothetical protein
VSHVRVGVTNNIVFWILWLGLLAFLYNYTQLTHWTPSARRQSDESPWRISDGSDSPTLLNARTNSFYNCHAAGIEVTKSYISSFLLCCHGNHVSIPKQRFGFLSVYNFQFPYPWKPCFVTSWFPRNNLSVVTYLPVCLLETAHMSHNLCKAIN